MARYRGPVCRFCRREGQKLFLKGDRCFSEKCAYDRRAYIPGQHGPTHKGKLSEFGNQLREKQKVKRVYGMLERQFRNTFKKALKTRGVTSEIFFRNLELRADNVIFRMGFARSRNEARQIVRHAHILVNGKSVNIPSMRLNIGDVVTVVEKKKGMGSIKLAHELYNKRPPLGWFEVDHDKATGKILSHPVRDDIHLNVRERLIVELYSK